jgi:DNA-binding response OmpR family regulator
LADPADVQPDNGEGRRILLVDDETSIRVTLAELLEVEGYVVDTAANGADALQFLRRVRPDAAIVDLMMPVMDGWALLRTCRSDAALADLPVIVMSARLDLPQTVADLAVQKWLVKPFDVDELLAALTDIWTRMASCSVCGTSGSDQRLPVFVEAGQTARWRLCASCWRQLETGFERLRPTGSFVAYLNRPGFRITDAEVRGYIRIGSR